MNNTSRDGGPFLWRQIYNARDTGHVMDPTRISDDRSRYDEHRIHARRVLFVSASRSSLVPVPSAQRRRIRSPL